VFIIPPQLILPSLRDKFCLTVFCSLEETIVDDEDEKPSSFYSEKYCEQIAAKIHLESSLPTECVQLYPGLLTNLRRRLSGTKNDHAIAFAGMGPGEAAAAMAAREKGQLSHAQIQRRFTKKSSRW